jgi:hypothetical protein
MMITPFQHNKSNDSLFFGLDGGFLAYICRASNKRTDETKIVGVCSCRITTKSVPTGEKEGKQKLHGISISSSSSKIAGSFVILFDRVPAPRDLEQTWCCTSFLMHPSIVSYRRISLALSNATFYCLYSAS